MLRRRTLRESDLSRGSWMMQELEWRRMEGSLQMQMRQEGLEVGSGCLAWTRMHVIRRDNQRKYD